MENFDFYSPTHFAFGRGRENDAGALVRRFGGKKALVHYGGGSAVRSGLLARVKASLDAAGVSSVELGGVRPNPRSELVYEGIGLAQSEGCDFILAIGGGSVIDSAKAIGIGVPYGGDFWDFYSGKAKVESSIPVGVVLTIAAAGSEGSGNSVISAEGGGLKRGAGSDIMRPKFAVMNPELAATLPSYQVACGGADIMAHVFERYFTNTQGVEATDCLCEGLLRAMVAVLPRAVENPADYDAQANVMWAGTLAHNNIVGVGREQDWASHGIEHELSAMYDVAHGAGLAVIFPSWMRFVVSRDYARFARLARVVWGISDANDESAAAKGIDALRSFWKSLGLPSTMDELGARREDLAYMASHVVEGRRGAFVRLSEADIVEIYESAFR
ncbi:MAG: iron-containing alcohol dehydrogenase [Rickettsiales bacterium]|jgi:alcohol dehydrogenase YqhD (iron-dependent ADH family)|nr:iron-containing alcohol dehydrogenase [Rickettsiales bacterium]